MNTKEVMSQLKAFGSEQTKKVLMRHGAREPFFGVKVQDLKKIQKKVNRACRQAGKKHELALDLYNTGNSDAMYLAGLISEPQKMSKEQLQDWAEKAYWYYISEYTIAWTTAESNYGWELALEWIKSGKENIASTGWATISSILATKKDEEIDLKKIEELLDIVAETIHSCKNRVKYTMNGFVISAGSYLKSLNSKSKSVAAKIGKVDVEMGGTSCKVPLAKEYIEKVESKNKVGEKRKTAFC